MKGYYVTSNGLVVWATEDESAQLICTELDRVADSIVARAEYLFKGNRRRGGMSCQIWTWYKLKKLTRKAVQELISRGYTQGSPSI